jgi:hypothetical protein
MFKQLAIAVACTVVAMFVYDYLKPMLPSRNTQGTN